MAGYQLLASQLDVTILSVAGGRPARKWATQVPTGTVEGRVRD